jgi:hypothetical protein
VVRTSELTGRKRAKDGLSPLTRVNTRIGAVLLPLVAWGLAKISQEEERGLRWNPLGDYVPGKLLLGVDPPISPRNLYEGWLGPVGMPDGCAARVNRSFQIRGEEESESRRQRVEDALDNATNLAL